MWEPLVRFIHVHMLIINHIDLYNVIKVYAITVFIRLGVSFNCNTNQPISFEVIGDQD